MHEERVTSEILDQTSLGSLHEVRITNIGKLAMETAAETGCAPV